MADLFETEARHRLRDVIVAVIDGVTSKSGQTTPWDVADALLEAGELTWNYQLLPEPPLATFQLIITATDAEPASDGVVEQGGPLAPLGYLCVTGGDTCPGHRSKWELCGMAPEPVVPPLHTHESGGPYRDCPACTAKAGRIRRHDPGALIEEPDLYEQGEGDDRG